MATNIVFFIFLIFHLSHAKVLDLSCSQIRTFVDGHNNNRYKLAKGEVPKQPPASEMKYMIWDKELAAKASQWASNNKFAHNPDRTVGSKRFTTGENIYMSFSTDLNHKLDISGALSSWFDEYKHYTYGPLKASDFTGSGEAIGHYTQMVWSNSIYLGCGVSQNINKGRMEYLVVCNYGPTGNYLGETPYKSNGSSSNQLLCVIKNCSRPYGEKYKN
ncbi:unnamed protein product, partial [Brenthis ino]